MVGLMLEYSPSNRAACKGARPCFGTKIAKGELRLGEPMENTFAGDGSVSYRFRHWGCVTRALLNTMKRAGGGRNVAGFARLSAKDQTKVLNAIQRGSVDPADVPPSARSFDYASIQRVPASTSSASTSQVPTASQTSNKRKRDEVPSSSQTTARTTTTGTAPLSTQQIVEISDSDSDSNSGAVAKKRKVEEGSVAAKAARALEARVKATFEAAQARAGTSASAINAASAAALNNDSRVIDLSDSDNEEDAGEDEVYLFLPTDVVGIKYYRGLVGYGEQVNLVREPDNQYDRNAIRVMNISGHQVGHLPKTVVTKLAPLLDRGLVSVEGTMTSGNLNGRNQWKLTIDISIIGPSDPESKKALEPALIWATPRQAGFDAMRSQTGMSGSSNKAPPVKGKAVKETAKATKLREIMDNLSQLDDSSRRETLLNSLCGQDVLELPLHPSPPSRKSGQLHTNLLKHQKQALLWCINAENPKLPTQESDPPVQFWQIKTNNNQKYYYNFATKTPQEEKPVLGRGGIIGDDMGLGKTLSVISLILATREEKLSSGYSGATLIVAPLSVLSNWSTQLEEHITEDAGLNAHVYYGDGRKVTASFLKKQDIVITTYQCVASDAPSMKTISNADGTESIQVKATQSGLFAVKWKRCVLDEGHTIRNPKTKLSQACYALDAERRWIVSGTPIINNPSDLGSLLCFLRICNPLNHPEYFKRLLSRPLGKRDPDAAELLKALMSSCCLRRTKEMQDKDGNSLVPLPPVVVNVVKVKLDQKSREFYDAVEELSRSLVQDIVTRDGQENQAPVGFNVLSMLTRLRQIALDRHLVPASYLEDLRAANKAHAHATQVRPLDISDEEKSRLQDILAQGIKDSEECPICFDTMTEPRITVCAHQFCLACITEVINRQRQCPLDRQPLGIEALIEPRPPQEDEDDESVLGEDEDEPPSAKIVQLIELLQVQPWHSKSLVFSQFTGFLDKIGVALRKAQIPFVRFDGSMSAKKRKLVLDAFSEPLTREEDPDEDQTEPESDDEGYTEYWDKRNGKGKGKAKAQAVSRLLDRGKTPVPVVMLISLKSGALGLNCTVANNVFLMDPWWQEAIESQAIDRVNRLGQKKDVFVYQMVAEDTIETKVLEIQERKKRLIQQAFSGTKTKQTQREKKEARLHELIQLFGEK